MRPSNRFVAEIVLPRRKAVANHLGGSLFCVRCVRAEVGVVRLQPAKKRVSGRAAAKSYSNSRCSPQATRNGARHAINLSIDDFFDRCTNLAASGFVDRGHRSIGCAKPGVHVGDDWICAGTRRGELGGFGNRALCRVRRATCSRVWLRRRGEGRTSSALSDVSWSALRR